MRFEQLLEAKEIHDYRHEDISAKIKPWGGGEKYIDPRDGFYWLFREGKLVLHSTENEYYSFIVSMLQSASEEEKEIAKRSRVEFGKIPRIKDAHNKISSMWNQLGGLVNFQDMTLTISKESSRDTMRQRPIANIAEFKQALSSLKTFGLTDEFVIKGVPPDIPKTVGQALQMRDYVQKTLQDRNLVMWHGTSEARWEIIQNKGLHPGNTGEAYVDLVPGYSEHNIYLAHTPKAAQFYAKRQAKKDNSTGVVLEIQVPDPNKIVADDRFAQYGGEIEGDKPNQIKSSIKELGEVGYRGWIPPKFIRKK
jgi:hypothetical protein